jgi:tRNA-splicing ligase RtcB
MLNPAINRVFDAIWQIAPSAKQGMKVPARIYATEKLLREMDEAVYDQLTNVATLPGITQYAFCMPDGHSGYGFPIGGVATMDVDKGRVTLQEESALTSTAACDL